MDPESLRAGETYDFQAVADAFRMKAAVLTWQGGIISRPAQNALLVITRPEPDSIDYHDRWEGDDLVYGARGRKGDQQMTGANKLLASNARINYVFEAVGSAKMKYRGIARAERHWWDIARGSDGLERKVIRYLLCFEGGRSTSILDEVPTSSSSSIEGVRRLRQHIMIERSRAIVADAKRRWRALDPTLRCEVCRMSFAEMYGSLGMGFIEAHHRIPLHTLTDETETAIQDLAPVCANCHRMLHVGEGCSIEELKGAFVRNA